MGELNLAGLAARGYLHVPALDVTRAELEQAGRLLDGLFARYDQLPAGIAHDLGGATSDEIRSSRLPRVPEILDTSLLEPRLRRTAVYRAADSLARALLGPRAYLTYDHAIYKEPAQSAPTSWHQDSGYDTGLTTGLAIWIPLQDTAEVDGCMRYVPGSHHAGRLEHSMRTGTDGKRILSLDVDPASWVAVPCGLGGAVVHDLHTVHGAGANDGARLRRAWILNYSTSTPLRSAARSIRRAIRTDGRQLRRLGISASA